METVKTLLLSCYSNLAMAYVNTKVYKKAADRATLALEIDPTNVKAFYRRALAKLDSGDDPKGAYMDLLAAAKIDPSNKCVSGSPAL